MDFQTRCATGGADCPQRLSPNRRRDPNHRRDRRDIAPNPIAANPLERSRLALEAGFGDWLWRSVSPRSRLGSSGDELFGDPRTIAPMLESRSPRARPRHLEGRHKDAIAAAVPKLARLPRGCHPRDRPSLLTRFPRRLPPFLSPFPMPSTLAYPRRQRQLEALLDRLGVTDRAGVDWALLDLALTHSSAAPEDNYERLEFFGDAVVRLAASELLMEAYPRWSVGDMAAVRSVLVSDRVLADIADSYGVERFLVVAGSAARDRAGRASRLADALEAIAGVLYLGGRGLSLVRPWLDDHFRPLAAAVWDDPTRRNYKAALQEWTQARDKTLPEYRTLEADDARSEGDRFASEIWFRGECLGRGRGRSRKEAEQAAAREAYQRLTAAPEGNCAGAPAADPSEVPPA